MKSLNCREDTAVIARTWSENYARSLPFIKYPLQFSDMPPTQPFESPTVGQHSEDILSQICGYSADKIGELKDKEII